MARNGRNPIDVDTTQTTSASYERVSKLHQARQGFSLGAQQKDTAQFAAEQGWLLPDHLRFRDGEEQDASGADWDLPDLNRMLDAAKRGEFQVLIVPDVDRFARNMVKGLVLEEQLRKHGVRVVYVQMPVQEGPEGNLQKNIKYIFAEYEREKIRLRTMRGRREKAERGMIVGQGSPSYGYTFVRNTDDRVIGLQPDPITAPTVVRIFELSKNRSANEVATILNKERTPSPAGGRWRENTIQRILNNTTYIGQALYGTSTYYKRQAIERGENVIIIPAPALTDQGTWTSVHEARLRRRSVRRGRAPTEEDTYILRGMLTCGHCGRHLACHATQNTRYYYCPQHQPKLVRLHDWDHVCVLPYLNAEALEEYAWAQVSQILLDREQLAEGIAASRSQHEQADGRRRDRLAIIDGAMREKRAQLDKIADKLLDAERGSELEALWARRAKEIERTLQQFKNERTALETMKTEGLSAEQATALEAFAAEVREGFEDFTPADIHEVFEMLQLQGTIRLDANGDRVGRLHRYDIKWECSFPLADSEHGILKACLLQASNGRAQVALYVVTAGAERHGRESAIAV